MCPHKLFVFVIVKETFLLRSILHQFGIKYFVKAILFIVLILIQSYNFEGIGISKIPFHFFSDNYEVHDAKKFFQENYSHIYYIFYDNFGNVEADLKQRGKPL